ncbi:hypothetical protein [Flavobacterium limi]|uniref:Uncharacterized protein n=1 Tax=Flavobacterium limi TaxID=2045105 RepID=A0ABQ1TXN9_9FLAO|nr:hypothetical protein [Flavobacterium limi]GGF04157.1 hypothetical protein GCM10011518_11700 [Flavobacterium limi]
MDKNPLIALFELSGFINRIMGKCGALIKKFNCDDIKYIIVNKESEMIALFDALDSMDDVFSIT